MNKEDEEKDEWDETDKCYLVYDEDGCLTCLYNHRAGAKCLMNVDY